MVTDGYHVHANERKRQIAQEKKKERKEKCLLKLWYTVLALQFKQIKQIKLIINFYSRYVIK